MSKRLDEVYGYNVRERLIELGYTTEEEISEQIRLIEILVDTLEEIDKTEGKEAGQKFLNGIMVKQFMNN